MTAADNAAEGIRPATANWPAHSSAEQDAASFADAGGSAGTEPPNDDEVADAEIVDDEKSA